MNAVSDSRDLAPRADAVALVSRSGPNDEEQATTATKTLTGLYPASHGLTLESKMNREDTANS